MFSMAKSKELAALKQFLILRHLQTAGARLRNQSATSRIISPLKWNLLSSLILAATKTRTCLL